MYNDLLDLMREIGIKWDDPTVYGAPFLRALRDALWYVDGHHDTIAEKAPKIPEVFAKKFVGYNCPESHKHRKRVKGNLCRSELGRHTLVLQDKLQASWFKKPAFKELATAVEGLVGSLNAYSAYLHEKTKYQKMHHELNSPSATPSDPSHLEYLPEIATISSLLQPIDEMLKKKEPYVPIAVSNFAPDDRRQRYRCVYVCRYVSVCVCVCVGGGGAGRQGKIPEDVMVHCITCTLKHACGCHTLATVTILTEPQGFYFFFYF